MHFLFPWIQHRKDSLAQVPTKFNLFSLYMYELYSLCASLLCKIQKMKHNKKEDKALQRGKTVCRWNSDHVKLPVLSCSQLLKITGLKIQFYNVLALDRCSTCVTVLIYKTKMVTVNYVFLCAFFKHRGRRLLGHDNS